jgi:hypothetical protein
VVPIISLAIISPTEKICKIREKERPGNENTPATVIHSTDGRYLSLE